MRFTQRFLISFSLLVIPLTSASLDVVQAEELLIDVVLASVDGVPITLSELSTRLGRRIPVAEISTDQEARSLLDAMISQHVLFAEAEQRRIEVSDTEVDEYVKGVATKNNMALPEFLEALKGTGTSLELYKEQVKVEILKSRITSQELRESVAISNEEVERYIDEHPHQFARGMKVTLRTLLLSAEKHSKEERKSLADKLAEALDDDEDFAELVRKYSDGSEASEGGLIGEVLEKELSPKIFDAVFSLDEGEMSKPVESSQGTHFFYVEKRIDDEEELSESTKEKVRKMLEQQQLEMKLASFFTDELYRSHAVDRKI
jgi:peptidyl-prolyl cis-trans isomerase SurA